VPGTAVYLTSRVDVVQPNVPRVLEECRAHQLVFDMMDTSFFVGRVVELGGQVEI
jgi:K+ transporter